MEDSQTENKTVVQIAGTASTNIQETPIPQEEILRFNEEDHSDGNVNSAPVTKESGATPEGSEQDSTGATPEGPVPDSTGVTSEGSVHVPTGATPEGPVPDSTGVTPKTTPEQDSTGAMPKTTPVHVPTGATPKTTPEQDSTGATSEGPVHDTAPTAADTDSTDSASNTGARLDQSQFFYEKSLTLIENETKIINTKTVFLSNIEGLLFTSYGVCLKIFAEHEAFSAFILVFIIPFVGSIIAIVTFFSVLTTEKMIKKIEESWKDYLSWKKLDRDSYPLLFWTKKDKNGETATKSLSSQKHKSLVSKGLTVLVASVLILIIWVIAICFNFMLYRDNMRAFWTIYVCPPNHANSVELQTVYEEERDPARESHAVDSVPAEEKKVEAKDQISAPESHASYSAPKRDTSEMKEYDANYWRTRKDLSAFAQLNITKIVDSSFAGCSSLASIIIPSTVTEIGDYAFSGCVGLTSFVIPSSVKTIGKHAFAGCTGLKSIVIPKTITAINGYMFSGCTGLNAVLLHDQMKMIDSHAFSECTGLTSIAIPQSVETIGSYAFANCKGLTSVLIQDQDGVGVGKIADHAFSGCSELKTIVIPPTVTEIGPYAFSGCTQLNSIVIPSSIKKIDKNAFSGCIELKSVVLPSSLETIEAHAFSGCEKLPDIIIPPNVTRIEEYAFANCGTLENVSISPESKITAIGDHAFSACSKLKSFVFPSSFTEIGKNTFSGCGSLDDTSMFSWYSRLPDDDAEIQLKLGEFYENGKGMKNRNIHQALECYRRIAENNTKAQMLLGHHHFYGIGLSARDLREAEKWFEKVVEEKKDEKEVKKAQYYLGLICEQCKKTINEKDAIEWFEKAAEGKDGLADAQFRLGHYWNNEWKKRHPGNKDNGFTEVLFPLEQYQDEEDKIILKNAKDWLSMAAAQDFLDAQYWLGWLYLCDENTRENNADRINEALSWLVLAASQGHIGANLDLGLLLLDDNEISPYYSYIGKEDKDNNEAVRRIESAANPFGLTDDQISTWKVVIANAQYYLGKIYLVDRIEKKDEKKAEELLEKASKYLSIAQNELGILYANGGTDIKKNIDQAKFYFTKAAEYGNNPDAQCNLGAYFWNKGELDEAKKWFQKAADNGSSDGELGLFSLQLFNNGELADIPDEVLKDYEKRVAEFKVYEKNEENDRKKAVAQFCVGVCYESRNRIDEARNNYEMAAKAGLAEAQCALGVFLLRKCEKAEEAGLAEAQSTLFSLEKTTARNWLEAAAAHPQPFPLADYNLGLSYWKDKDEKEQKKAASWFRKAADKGLGLALAKLGDCYALGKGGVVKDTEEAFKWYHNAAEQKNAYGQFNVGMYYYHGTGIDQDFKEAAKWFRRAADQDYLSAQLILAEYYEMGIGGITDLYEAFKWYHNAAEQNNAFGQFKVGMCYYCGIGTDWNFEEAVKWYRKAADQDYLPAQLSLAGCYEGGNGVEKDTAQAKKWLEKAANHQFKGDSINSEETPNPTSLEKEAQAKAQYNLGVYFENGIAGERDISKAKEWYRKAADNGYEPAQRALDRLNAFSLGKLFSWLNFLHL